jgi:S-formylglutathione hydrolase FrmB
MVQLDFRKFCLILVPLTIAIFSPSLKTFGQDKVIISQFHSKSLKENRSVKIFLPNGYNPESSTKYPVIYFLPGGSGKITENPELYVIKKPISPVIIVQPDGSAGDWVSLYVNSELLGNFEDYIVFDLVEFVDSAFNTISSRDKRAIMGSSAGAAGAMGLAIKHPDVYCGAATYSGFLDMSKLSLYIPYLLSENGGSPVHNYRPGAGYFSTFFFIGSEAYSPNLNKPPYYVDYPVDSVGNWIDSIWNRWLLHDCALLIRNLSRETNLAIYFDCGIYDDIYPFNTGFADSLNKLGIAYEFQSYTGGHMDQWVERFSIGLHFLDSAMNKTSTNIAEELTNPAEFVLYQNHPNPFNPSTTLSFVIGHSSFATLKVYDILGKEVATLVNETKPAGSYEVTWNAANLPSGVYFYKLKAGNYTATKKLLLLK